MAPLAAAPSVAPGILAAGAPHGAGAVVAGGAAGGASTGTMLAGGAFLGGTALSAIAQQKQGKAQEKLYKAQAAAAAADALAQKNAGLEKARIKREENRRFTGIQLASQAQSGVVAGAGTPLQILIDDAILGERDAQNIQRGATYAGQRGLQEAGFLRAQGGAAKRAGNIGAFTTAMTGGASLALMYGSRKRRPEV
jgi:hypothetical protein